MDYLEPDLEAGERPKGVVLVLHGGKVKSHQRASALQLATLRMRPFTQSLHRAGRSRGLVVGQVLFRLRGWNGSEQSPVLDVQSVLEEIRGRYGDVPVVLVGHSMGGRAALQAAGDTSVAAVVGLAPWIEKGDQWRQLAHRRLLVIHGNRDRWTDMRESIALVERLQGVATTASFVEMRKQGHTMIGRGAEWSALTTGFVLNVLGMASETTPDANILHTRTIADVLLGAVAGAVHLIL